VLFTLSKKRRSLEEIQTLVNKGNEHAFYVSREWKDVRKEVLNRDNNECQRCKGNFVVDHHPIKKVCVTKARYVHHIKPMKDYFSYALDMDNLVSLCFSCHEIVEGRSGKWKKPSKKRLTEEKW
jgi:5-methylcytosine-specific restriction protein A